MTMEGKGNEYFYELKNQTNIKKKTEEQRLNSPAQEKGLNKEKTTYLCELALLRGCW